MKIYLKEEGDKAEEEESQRSAGEDYACRCPTKVHAKALFLGISFKNMLP